MITPAELAEAQYNSRDVLGMCRVFPHLVAEVERANVVDVYNVDEQLADLALQMTRLGMPVNSELRHEIGQRLYALRDAAIEILRPYTEGEHREDFLGWVATFFAAKARNGEPVEGSLRIGPTRAQAAVDEVLDVQRQWREYKKTNKEDAAAVATADQMLAEAAAALKLAKLDLKAARFEDDANDTLVHTAESAFALRMAIRKADAELAITKAGVKYTAKVQQAAILRTAGVPLTRVTDKSKLPKIDKDVLETFSRHPAAKALLKFILVSSTINVYIEGEKRAGKGGGKSKPVMVTADGYLRPLWQIHKITGRWGSSPNCFDGETEYLTNRGWIRADVFGRLSYRESLRVAQFDKVSRTIAFVEPTGVIERHFVGDMVRLQRRNIDLLVTPDHRLLLGRRDGVWEDVPACDLIEDRKMWLAGECYRFGNEKPTPAWIAFLCAAQADGHWNGSGWVFGFTRERKIQRMRWLLRELNLQWSEDVGWFDNPFLAGTRRQRTIFYVKKSDVGSEIHNRLGDSKVFGSWLLDFHRGAIEMLLYEIMLWDGSYTRRNCYSSSRKANADWVQLLFTLTGRRAYLRDYAGSEFQTKINWQVDVSAKTHTWTTNTEKSIVPWNGPVYCLSVPSSYIVVRRNGKPMVVGQCQNWSKRAGGGEENLRAMIEAPEGYTFVGADQAQLEARLVGAMSQCKYLCETFQRGEDIHGAFAYIGFPDVWPNLAATFKEHKKAVAKGDKCKCATCAERDRIRDLIKREEYGAIYGGAAKAIWESLVGEFPALTQRQVQVFLDSFARQCPEVIAWRNETLREAINDGEIRSPILGRRQVFPLGRVDPTVAFNYKAQSGGADLWALGALAFMELWDQFNSVDARLIHNGHDSVLILCRADLAKQVEADVYRCWNREWNGVPFFVEGKIANRWSET